MNKKKLRKLLSEETNGKCAYCGCDLQEGFHIDHIKPVSRYKEKDLNCLDNLLASCPKCNFWKKDKTIEEFREYIKDCANHCDDAYPRYRIGKKFGVITELTDKDIVFYAEKIGLLKKN